MSRYSETKISKKKIYDSVNEVQSYETTIYQKIPESNEDIFVIAQEGDRLDNLAYQFYGTPHLWYYIANANNLTTMNIEVGVQLRIPASTQFTNTQ
tara:strand:+ start:649 stop:936 length:288 start_codon:yes stop_codon:yes gene_type:complete